MKNVLRLAVVLSLLATACSSAGDLPPSSPPSPFTSAPSSVPASSQTADTTPGPTPLPPGPDVQAAGGAARSSSAQGW
jgi:hypothetical protein